MQEKCYLVAKMKDCVDLHVHSTASDGTLSPGEIVELAERISLRAIAITDHDTTDGLQAALKAGRGGKLEVIPGVEVSVDGGELSALHIVGLWVDGGHPILARRLEKMASGREQRARKMAEKLTELGCPMDLADVRHFAGGSVVGRPHFAQAMVERGCVPSMDEAFEKFLGRGKPAYFDRERMNDTEAIGLIREAGGVAVLAHPGLIKVPAEKFESQLKRLCSAGLGGMEVYYPKHTSRDVKYLKDLCRRFDLAPSGGTDFHGSVKPEIELGALNIPAEVLGPLREKAALAK